MVCQSTFFLPLRFTADSIWSWITKGKCRISHFWLDFFAFFSWDMDKLLPSLTIILDSFNLNLIKKEKEGFISIMCFFASLFCLYLPRSLVFIHKDRHKKGFPFLVFLSSFSVFYTFLKVVLRRKIYVQIPTKPFISNQGRIFFKIIYELLRANQILILTTNKMMH